MKADLHIHTTVSDGAMGPMEALRAAAGRGLAAVVAITDHDTDEAHRLLQQAAAPPPLPVIPGVEMDTIHRGQMLEILVFGHRVGEGPLAELLKGVRERRARRVEIIWASIRRGLGTELPPIATLYPPPRDVVTRPQMAASLCDSGLAPHPEGALEIVKAYDPGFEPPETRRAIAAASASEGLCVLAHPLQYPGVDLSALVHELAKSGLAGIEVDYPYSDAADRARRGEIAALAAANALFPTGGSDAHALEDLGRCRVDLPEPLRRFAAR